MASNNCMHTDGNSAESFGGGEAWQKWATENWIDRLSRIDAPLQQDRPLWRPHHPQGHPGHLERTPDPKALGTEPSSTPVRLGVDARFLSAT